MLKAVIQGKSPFRLFGSGILKTAVRKDGRRNRVIVFFTVLPAGIPGNVFLPGTRGDNTGGKDIERYSRKAESMFHGSIIIDETVPKCQILEEILTATSKKSKKLRRKKRRFILRLVNFFA
jgi:hypothetical protein